MVEKANACPRAMPPVGSTTSILLPSFLTAIFLPCRISHSILDAYNSLPCFQLLSTQQRVRQSLSSCSFLLKKAKRSYMCACGNHVKGRGKTTQNNTISVAQESMNAYLPSELKMTHLSGQARGKDSPRTDPGQGYLCSGQPCRKNLLADPSP